MDSVNGGAAEQDSISGHPCSSIDSINIQPKSEVEMSASNTLVGANNALAATPGSIAAQINRKPRAPTRKRERPPKVKKVFFVLMINE